MNKKILFSAVSGTDPIYFNRDGSILHICRKYKPNKVVLLLSSEICLNENNDCRYTKCIKKLGELLNHKFDVELIEEKDMVDVNGFDIVYPAIKENLDRILGEMGEGDSLYVNVSSGTPAMKYCLQFLSALADYKFTPIVVSTPIKKCNRDIKTFNVEQEWNKNTDNSAETYVDRCAESKSLPMLTEFYSKTIEGFIKSYNYSAALTMAKSQRLFPNELVSLLDGALSRLSFDLGSVETKLAPIGFEFPVKDEKQKRVFEYALTLGVKLKNEHYADFIRAITPLITDLLKMVLELKFNINIDEYTENNKWSKKNLQGSKVLEDLNTAFKNKFNFGFVKNIHLEELIIKYSDNQSEMHKIINVIKEFEQNQRNLAAHNMVSLSEEKIKIEIGKSPTEFYETIKVLIEMVGIPTCNWNSYDEMNDKLIACLHKYKNV